MYPASFEYLRPAGLDAVFSTVEQAGDDVKLIAGGQSLLPMMKLRLATPAVLVDLAGAPELRGQWRTATGVRIGALTTYRELQRSETVQLIPGLGDTMAVIADAQVRARGTVGGAVAHGDPTADLPAMLLALDARVLVSSARGDRAVELAHFITGIFDTDLADDEVITGIEVPVPLTGTGAAYEKFEQPASHLALCGVAAAVTVDGGGIRKARVAVTGVSSTPRRLPAVEEVLDGAVITETLLDEAAAAAVRGVVPLDDLHAPATYRLHLLKTAARQAIAVAVSRAGMGWAA